MQWQQNTDASQQAQILGVNSVPPMLNTMAIPQQGQAYGFAPGPAGSFPGFFPVGQVPGQVPQRPPFFPFPMGMASPCYPYSFPFQPGFMGFQQQSQQQQNYTTGSNAGKLNQFPPNQFTMNHHKGNNHSNKHNKFNNDNSNVNHKNNKEKLPKPKGPKIDLSEVPLHIQQKLKALSELDTPEALAAYIEDRRRNFPTKETVKARDEERKEREQRGELLEITFDHFDHRRGRGRGRGRDRDRGRGRGRGGGKGRGWGRTEARRTDDKEPNDLEDREVIGSKRISRPLLPGAVRTHSLLLLTF